MIAIDTNILVYAHRVDSDWHVPAARCVRELAEGASPWAIPWPCVHEFLAITTHPRIYEPPTPLAHALEQVDAWLESPSVTLLTETSASWSTIRRTLDSSRVVGPRVHDARVASLCVSNGVRELWSADRDFQRFSELNVRNPLV